VDATHAPTRHFPAIAELTGDPLEQMPSDRPWWRDWEFWHAVAVVALLAWIYAQTHRFVLMDRLQALAWSAHETVQFVPQASLDQVRPLVDGFVALWLPVAIGSFVVGFFLFHADAEAETEAAPADDDD